jgi:hypothetical protein
MRKRASDNSAWIRPQSEIVLGHTDGGLSVDDIARGLRLLEREASRSGQRFLAHLIGVAVREAHGEGD